MCAHSNAFLRHRIIDACLRDTKKNYTLLDLIKACSQALNEKYPSKKSYNVSLRTIQLDLQIMRDKKRGYGAPIVVYNQKYYKYKDPDYTIESVKIKKDNLNDLSEIVDTLKHYSKFNELNNLKSITNILEEEIASKIQKRVNVISYESKRDALGLEYFDTIYDAIVNKKALCIGYFSSRSNNIMSIIFYPFYLKEYKGRWYALGYKDGLNGVYKLPLDRIRDYSYSILPFPQEYSFNPDDYFKDIIGVTKLSGEVKEIRYLVKNKLAPFIKLNPLHHSQTLAQLHENGDMEFTINIIPNKEFYNLIFDYQPNINIISPREIGVESNNRILEIVEQLPDYTLNKNREEVIEQNNFKNDINLFSNL